MNQLAVTHKNMVGDDGTERCPACGSSHHPAVSHPPSRRRNLLSDKANRHSPAMASGSRADRAYTSSLPPQGKRLPPFRGPGIYVNLGNFLLADNMSAWCSGGPRGSTFGSFRLCLSEGLSETPSGTWRRRSLTNRCSTIGFHRQKTENVRSY